MAFFMRSYFVLTILLFVNYSLSAQDSCACCTANHSAFDFWVGQWTVSNPDGTFAGNNTIRKQEDGCVIREQWTSATPGYTGTSINYYDQVLAQWVQLWVDNQGQSLYLRGGIVERSMVLQSDLLPGADGVSRYNRVTWTPLPEGKVRQHWEVSTDGLNWSTAFDGLYSPI